MASLKTMCGHCGKESILQFSFTTLFTPEQPKKGTLYFTGMAICPLCRQYSVFECAGPSAQRPWELEQAVKNNNIELERYADISVIKRFPPMNLAIHVSWPVEIRQLLRDAERHLRDGTSPITVIAECRAVLEAVTKKLNAKGGNLKDRIDDLKQKGIIVGSLAEWSHQLRLNGNSALHELEGDANDAKMLYDFILMLLNVCFTLPFEIDQRKSAQQQPK